MLNRTRSGRFAEKDYFDRLTGFTQSALEHR